MVGLLDDVKELIDEMVDNIKVNSVIEFDVFSEVDDVWFAVLVLKLVVGRWVCKNKE